ncbi:MAG TPA: DoxX family protein [Pyrinomonadaceae bacterium]|nr:DoxX family protein [Pyrinomonadaceae bacterium]
MADHNSFTTTWAPRALSILRIASAFLLMQHGAQKVFGVLRQAPPPGAPAPPPFAFDPFSLMGVGGILEFFGGLLLLVGLFTRPVAFILSGLMAVAYFGWHYPAGFWPILNRGELAALYSFVFLYLAAAGPGPWSLDRLLRRGRSS